MSKQLHRLLRDAAQLDLANVFSTAHAGKHQEQGLIGAIDHSASEDLIKQSMRTPLTHVLRQFEAQFCAKHEVFGENDASRRLSLQRECVAGLLSTLALLVVVHVDPHVGDVVVEYFTDFVNDSSRQLWTNLGTGDPAAHSLNLPFLGQTNRLDSLGPHLFDLDETVTKGTEASFEHLQRKRAFRIAAKLLHQVGESSSKTVHSLVIV